MQNYNFSHTYAINDPKKVVIFGGITIDNGKKLYVNVFTSVNCTCYINKVHLTREIHLICYRIFQMMILIWQVR